MTGMPFQGGTVFLARRNSAMIRLTTGVASLVAIGAMVAMSAPAADGTVTPYPGGTTSTHVSTAHVGTAHGSTVWAVTVSGRKVRLAKPTFKPTPVRPGKPAHGGTASMAAVNRKYAPWGRSTTKPRVTAVPQLPGIDVSGYQGNINWAAVAPHIDFSYAKATEGTYYTNPDFTNQYEGGPTTTASSAAPITSASRRTPPGRPRRTTSSATAAAGRATA